MIPVVIDVVAAVVVGVVIVVIGFCNNVLSVKATNIPIIFPRVDGTRFFATKVPNVVFASYISPKSTKNMFAIQCCSNGNKHKSNNN